MVVSIAPPWHLLHNDSIGKGLEWSLRSLAGSVKPSPAPHLSAAWPVKRPTLVNASPHRMSVVCMRLELRRAGKEEPCETLTLGTEAAPLSTLKE